MGSLIPITDAQYLAHVRARCEADFTFFVRYFFKHRKGMKFVFNWHHELICEHLMQVYSGEVQNLIINIPPRYSKTELVVILFTAWCYAKNPRCEFIHLSYSADLTFDNSSAIREVIRSTEFQQLWPTTFQPHKDAKRAWATAAGGVFLATAMGGAVTGFGAGRLDELDADGDYQFNGCLLIDDPLKPDDARHDTLREGVNRRWDETIKSRRNSPRTPTIVIMQRIHMEDFTARLLQDTELSWKLLALPALVDAGTPNERPLWEAKHTVDALHAMRDKKNDRGEPNPIAQEMFSAQMQQNPAPAGGGLLKEAWWRHHDQPLADVIRDCSAFVISADTAYTSDNSNDASSLGLWGAEGATRLTRLAEHHGHWEFPELLQQFVRLWLMAPRGTRQVLIEAKANGLSLVQTLRKGIRLDADVNLITYDGRTVEKKAGDIVKIPAAPWSPKAFSFSDDKVGRVQDASWQIHAGNVWLMSAEKASPGYAPWVRPTLDEYNSFTRNDTHKADDRTDEMTMAVSWWTKYGGGRE